MIEHFTGENGKERVKSALVAGPLFGDDESLLERVVEELELIRLSLDDVLIGNGRGERDLFVILAGKLGVVTDGEIVAIRKEGDYVGEMSLIDSATKRSATVAALDTSVVGRLSEPAFTALADTHPALWRRLAIAMVRRVTEQG